jgi:DNA-binding transcriptional ArsR family regulator
MMNLKLTRKMKMIPYCSLLTPSTDTLSEPLGWLAQLAALGKTKESAPRKMTTAEKRRKLSEDTVLASLKVKDWSRVIQISRELNGPAFSPSTVSQRLTDLSKKGLAERMLGGKGYAVFYRLTEDGVAYLQKLQEEKDNE